MLPFSLGLACLWHSKQSVSWHHSCEIHELHEMQAVITSPLILLASSLSLGFTVSSVLPLALMLCCLNYLIILFYRITF